MADPLDPHVDPGDTGAAPGRGPKPGIPRWVKLFGIIALVLIAAIVVVLLIGGGHGPGRHLGPRGQTEPSTGHQNASGVGEPADADVADRTVEVTTLDSMTFEPNTINVSAGETVTFEVTNTGQAPHEFTLGDAAMQQEHAEAMAHMPARMAHDTPNSITMQPGETKQLTWRFGGEATLEYACHQPGHYQAGMRGQITIT
jgi:uncharacterized cupredoxin-like copper-binding protein